MRAIYLMPIVIFALPIGLAIAAPSVPATMPMTDAAQGSPRRVAGTESPDIAAEITRLGDADPTIRRHAADALAHIGASARPAVLAASRSDQPQLADAAAQVLRSLPWSMPDDPPKVKTALDKYGESGVPARTDTVAKIADEPNSQPALLRLLGDEMNEDICWTIERLLVQRPDPKTLLAARHFDLGTSRPAALVLAGKAWLMPLDKSISPINHDRANAYFLRAVELESSTMTYDDGELDLAFDQLAAKAVADRRYEDAASLRRQQCKRIGVTRDTFPSPFFELLVLHERFGPLTGLADDLQAYQSYAAAPEALFVFSQMYARQGNALMAQSLKQAALAASSTEQSRAVAREFLVNHRWNDLATQLCQSTLARADTVEDQDDFQAHLWLSSFAATRGDETQAADQMQIALDSPKNFALDAQTDRGLKIAINLHRLRAARAHGDIAQLNHLVDELARQSPDDEDTAIDLVPELKARGRKEEAERIFEACYQPLLSRVDSADADPTLMNDLAWLCARCDEHIDQAVDLSNQAVAADPNSSAFLDTNAEAHFRVGQAREAARLEALALKIEPHDPFMEGQLKRFESAASTQPAR